MTPFTVFADPEARDRGDLDAVVASLPVSLAYGARPADLVAVSGSHGWSGRLDAAILDGARGVVVVDPVGDEAPVAAIPVVLDQTFASHPGVHAARDAAARIPAGALLEIRIATHGVEDLADELLRGIALSRAVTRTSVAEGRLLARGAHGLTVRATLDDGRPALFTVTRTTAIARSARVRLLGDTAVEVVVPDSSAARPARVTVTGPDASGLLPTVYETAHRASWRRLHRAVIEGRPTTDLADFSDDLRALHAILDD